MTPNELALRDFQDPSILDRAQEMAHLMKKIALVTGASITPERKFLL
jgi:hypothetical protein